MSIFGGKNQTKVAEWEQLIRSTIASIFSYGDPEEQYVWVIAKSMVGCLIGLLVKNRLFKRLKDLHATKIKTGLGGSSGNKGAVIVRFKLDDTTIALINCHLMSGKNKGSKRTDEINFIFDNAFKNEPPGKRYNIEAHDLLFLFGDLNYRITLPNDVVRPSCKTKDWDLLKGHDELI